MFVKAFAPALDASLGIYLPLIVVNCIILGRAEAFASKNPVLASTIDGIGMGVGFTFAISLMASIREFLGAGNLSLKVLGFGTNLTDIFNLGETDVLTAIGLEPILIFILAPGGFFCYGLLMACANKLAEMKGKPKAELKSCDSCPLATSCAIKIEGKECAK